MRDLLRLYRAGASTRSPGDDIRPGLYRGTSTPLHGPERVGSMTITAYKYNNNPPIWVRYAEDNQCKVEASLTQQVGYSAPALYFWHIMWHTLEHRPKQCVLPMRGTWEEKKDIQNGGLERVAEDAMRRSFTSAQIKILDGPPLHLLTVKQHSYDKDLSALRGDGSCFVKAIYFGYLAQNPTTHYHEVDLIQFMIDNVQTYVESFYAERVGTEDGAEHMTPLYVKECTSELEELQKGNANTLSYTSIYTKMLADFLKTAIRSLNTGNMKEDYLHASYEQIVQPEGATKTIYMKTNMAHYSVFLDKLPVDNPKFFKKIEEMHSNNSNGNIQKPATPQLSQVTYQSLMKKYLPTEGETS